MALLLPLLYIATQLNKLRPNAETCDTSSVKNSPSPLRPLLQDMLIPIGAHLVNPELPPFAWREPPVHLGLFLSQYCHPRPSFGSEDQAILLHNLCNLAIARMQMGN